MVAISLGCGSKPDNSFEIFSEEELTGFIEKTLDRKLFSASDPSQRIKLSRVEACKITFQYKVLFPSGESMLQEAHIPTEDMRIDKEGRIFYTQKVISNCASEKDEEIQLRVKEENILVKYVEKNIHDVNRAIQYLNDFCTDNNN